MSDGSKIEWTDATWNPTSGCTPVSEGCDHCYAKRIHERFHGAGSFEKVELHPERLDATFRWRKPRRVFADSMSDLWHDDVPDEFVAEVFAIMALAPQHTFQLLTKRPGRMASVIPRLGTLIEELVLNRELSEARVMAARMDDPRWWPLPNVWLGVSVENQKWADVRIPKLLETPAAVRFLSCEPLLGLVNLAGLLQGDARVGIDWVIVGGESGPGARPMHWNWARSVRDQCIAAGVPFFFKGWGGRTPKAGGRELDGRTWDQYPRGAA